MIFLDNAGTTKMFEQCIDVHKIYSCEKYFNPSAQSLESLEISKEIASAQKYFLQRLGAKEGTVLFTSCATESNNLAVKGSLRTGNWEYVFSAGEHPSVYNVAKKLEMDGYKVHIVPLDKAGKVDLLELEKVLNEKTRLISIMHVSNETGAINDIEEISRLKLKKSARAIFHVDGVQAFMKIPFEIKKTSVDLYSFSAHKLHGPKGIAGLYVKNKDVLKELFQGGGQQFGLRSGTENVSGIMQFKKAVEIIDEKLNFKKVTKLKQIFNQNLSGVKILNFEGSPYIENLIFTGVKGETMMHALNQEGVIVGLGSACSSKKAGNRVLEEIGLDKNEVISSIRISFNAYQTEKEVAKAGEIISKVYLNLKERMGI